MAWIKNRAQDIETGAPLTTGNALIRDATGSLLATIAVDGSTGFAEYKVNHQPGVISWEYENSDQKKIVSGAAFGQANTVMMAEVELVYYTFGDGTLTGVLSGLPLTAPGGMNVTVGTGAAMNKGVLDPVYTAETLAISAANPSNPRIDRIVSRLTRTGTFAGKTVFAVLTGVPSATPVVPSLTQTADTNEVEIGRVTVPAGATAIISGNLSTTTRPVASPATAIGDGAITQAMLAKPSVGTPELFDGSVTLAKLSADAKQTGQGLVNGLINAYWISAQNVLGGQYPALVSTGGLGGGGTVIPAANFDVNIQTLYACPIYIPRNTTLTGVAIDVISGGSAVTVRLGIYNAGTNGLPTSLISGGDLGTIAMTASGVQQKTISPAVSIAAGWYWAAVVFSSTTPLVQGLHSIRDFFGSPGPGDNTAYGFLQAVHSAGTASLPPTYPSPGVSAAGPNIYLRTGGT